MSDTVSRQYIVRGRVQGVGFRWWTRQMAMALDLAGWVRNRPDGTVEIHASGAGAAISRLEAELALGPRFSTVEHVEKVDASLEMALDKPFVIR